MRVVTSATHNRIEITGFRTNNNEDAHPHSLLDSLLSSKHYNHVAITSLQKLQPMDEVEAVLTVLKRNSEHFDTLRLSLISDPILTKILQHLTGNLRCHTLGITMCSGYEWMPAAGKFISSSNGLREVCLQCSTPNLGTELIETVIRSPNLKKLSFTQVDKYTPRGFYKTLTDLISDSQLEVLETSGRNFSPWGVRAMHGVLRTNTRLRAISFPHRFYRVDELARTLEEFKNIVCADHTVHTIASSNHTLCKVDLSTHHKALHNALQINRSSQTTKMKIKQKIFFHVDKLEEWMSELAKDNTRAALKTHRKNRFLCVHLIHWLANNNDGVEVMAQQMLFQFYKSLVSLGTRVLNPPL